ncbi:MAG TPA: heme-copper oxidase subunit III [Acidimicrobiales bacterium]|jgi:heme/copper-type cytochrome/quinol oxidase subunit 3|nr:heme-copper oxidase subunit III [Acidimicrobiales bacterium]
MSAVTVPAAPDPSLVTPTPKRTYSTPWWGMMTLISTESMVFVILLGSYFFLRASAPHWPLGGIKPPELHLSLPFSFVLWGSSLPVFYAEAAIRRGSQAGLRSGLMLSGIMGVAFLAYTLYDFNSLTFGWRTNAYGSIFYLIVGLHALHVFIGLCMNGIVQIKAWQGKFTATRHTTVEVFSLYWHFVDAVWIFVFASLFLSEAIK